MAVCAGGVGAAGECVGGDGGGGDCPGDDVRWVGTWVAGGEAHGPPANASGAAGAAVGDPVASRGDSVGSLGMGPLGMGSLSDAGSVPFVLAESGASPWMWGAVMVKSSGTRGRIRLK